MFLVMGKNALEKAIQIVGGQSELGRLLGKNQSAVWSWLNKTTKGVPAEFAPEIEELTNGEVSRYQLRPDVFGEAP